MAKLREYIAAMGEDGVVSLGPPPSYQTPQSQKRLETLETRFKILDMYLWLSQKFPNEFVDRHIALEEQELCSATIQDGLDYLNRKTRRKMELRKMREEQEAHLETHEQ